MKSTMVLTACLLSARVRCSRSFAVHESPSFRFGKGSARRLVDDRATTTTPKQTTTTTTTTRLGMGILDSVSSFFGPRGNDFVPITSAEDVIGPPVVLLLGVPNGIAHDEFRDMVSDGAPEAWESGVAIRVINDDDGSFLDRAVEDALNEVRDDDERQRRRPSLVPSPPANKLEIPCPVVYCSGLSNKEMMGAYNIIAKEIYEETAGASRAACAKAVAPAMKKTLRQVVGEITGDHMDAINVWT